MYIDHTETLTLNLYNMEENEKALKQDFSNCFTVIYDVFIVHVCSCIFFLPFPICTYKLAYT